MAARSQAKVCGRSLAGIMGLNPTGSMDVCLLCVVRKKGLCDELVTCPEKSYRLWCVVVCDLETSGMRGGAMAPWGLFGQLKQID